jgi:hypothetical protein
MPKQRQENFYENFKEAYSITQISICDSGVVHISVCHSEFVLEQIFGTIVRRS